MLDALAEAVARDDLASAERSASAIEAGEDASSAQADRLLAICEQLAEGAAGAPDRRTTLAGRLALVALEQAEQHDVETDLRLLDHARAALATSVTDELALRRRVALAWLRVWRDADAILAQAATEDGSVQLNIAPPPGQRFSSGTAAEQIEDPQARASYEAEIEANRLRGERAALAQRLRPQVGALRDQAGELLAGGAGPAPFSIDELRDLLAEHVRDEGERARILGALETS